MIQLKEHMIIQSPEEFKNFCDNHIKNNLNIALVIYIINASDDYFAWTNNIFFKPMIIPNNRDFPSIEWITYKGKFSYPIKIYEDKDEFESLFIERYLTNAY